MLTYDEYVDVLAQVLAGGDDVGAISELLSDLKGNYTDIIAQIENLRAENARLVETNASLVKANGELFLQVGVGKKEEETFIEEEEDFPTVEEVLEEVLDEKGRFK